MFQDRIWSICFNVVVCARIQRRKKKKRKREKRIKRKRKEKEKCQKEENKKGSHQILWSEMEGRNTALKKKKRWKKNLLNGNSKKSWHSDKSWKHFLYLPYPFLFYSLYFYPTLRPNKVLIWSRRLCSSDIDMTE